MIYWDWLWYAYSVARVCLVTLGQFLELLWWCLREWLMLVGMGGYVWRAAGMRLVSAGGVGGCLEDLGAWVLTPMWLESAWRVS